MSGRCPAHNSYNRDAVKRPAARLLIVNRRNEILLFHYAHKKGPLAGTRFWATPGGALESGESFEQAARRELTEETGIVAPVGEPVHIHFNRFLLPDGRTAEAEERYFFVFTDSDCDPDSNPDAAELEAIAEARWWRPEEIARTQETIYPVDILPLLARLAGLGVTQTSRPTFQ